MIALALRKTIPATLLVILTLLLLTENTPAKTMRGRHVRLPFGETVTGNLVVDGGTVEILGRVQGDLTVRAGSLNQVGAVGGDVTVSAGRAELRGPIGGSVRATGASLNVYGEVAGDVELTGGDVRLVEGAVILGNLTVRGGTVTIVAGSYVDYSLRGTVLNVTIEGSVWGDVDLSLRRLTLAPGGHIGGVLRYESRVPAQIAPGATVTGPIERRDPAARIPAGEVLLWHNAAIPRFLAMVLIGLVLVLFLPQRMVAVADAPRQAPVSTALTGLGIALFAPLALLVLVLLVVTIPIAVIGGALYLAVAYSSMVIVGLTVGRAVLQRRPDDRRRVINLAALTLGLVILAALRLLPLPFADSVIAVGIAVVGLGAFANRRRAYRTGVVPAVTARRSRPFGSLLLGIIAGGGAVLLALGAIATAVATMAAVLATVSGSASFGWKASPTALGLTTLMLAMSATALALGAWLLIRWRGV